jgi:hypothetical protein
MKAVLFCLAFFPVLTGCWKPPLIGNSEGYEWPLIPELVKTRAKYFANRYGVNNICLIQKEQVVYEPFAYIGSLPDSTSWRKRMNKEANAFCDSVLRDHKELLSAIALKFDVFFFDPTGVNLKGTISFEYNDLTKYPFGY